MIDRKQLLLIGGVGIVAILFFILVVISAFLPKNTETVSDQPAVTDGNQSVVIPTSSQSIPTPLPKEEGIQLISVNPPDGFKEATIIEQITMSFSSPMNEKKFYYKVEPTTSTFIHTEGEKVIITADSGWKIGTTTITVYDASQAIDGTKLATPFKYTFEVLPFPTPIPGIE